VGISLGYGMLRVIDVTLFIASVASIMQAQKLVVGFGCVIAVVIMCNIPKTQFSRGGMSDI
jgi:hypothetical protein